VTFQRSCLDPQRGGLHPSIVKLLAVKEDSGSQLHLIYEDGGRCAWAGQRGRDQRGRDCQAWNLGAGDVFLTGKASFTGAVRARAYVHLSVWRDPALAVVLNLPSPEPLISLTPQHWPSKHPLPDHNAHPKLHTKSPRLQLHR
jgi:hypothetical protein